MSPTAEAASEVSERLIRWSGWAYASELIGALAVFVVGVGDRTNRAQHRPPLDPTRINMDTLAR